MFENLVEMDDFLVKLSIWLKKKKKKIPNQSTQITKKEMNTLFKDLFFS